MEPLPDVIYNVTLPSGMVVTSPHEFGVPHAEFGPTGPIITLDGRVLVPPAQRPSEDDSTTEPDEGRQH